MSTTDTSLTDTPFDPNEAVKLPSTLNVLTILTLIGSGFAAIMSLASPWSVPMMLKFMETRMSNAAELTASQLSDLEKGKRALELNMSNLYPMMLVGLVGAALCIAGALMMRKRRRDGFWIYTGGELLPLIASIILLEGSQFSGVGSYVAGLGIPLLFVVLYALQRKHLLH